MARLGLSSLSTSTIAAPCAWRTVSAVIAIQAYLGGEDPGRKSSRQFQRGFESPPSTPSREPGVRRLGLLTGFLYNARPGTREVAGARAAESGMGATDAHLGNASGGNAILPQNETDVPGR